MRAHLLLVKLPYNAESLRRELESLVAVLPSGSRRVLWLEQLVGFLVPYKAIADIQALHWREVMKPFADWWIMGLNGELVCKNKSNDPFRTWMDELRRTGTLIERDEAKHLPFAERGKPRVEPSINDLIERTFGKVGVKPPPESE